MWRPDLRILLVWLLGVAPMFGLDLYHEAPSEVLEGVPVILEVLPPFMTEDPDFINLYIRTAGGDLYQEIPFAYHEGGYRCQIPAAWVTAPGIEYYIGASYGIAGFAAVPAENPADQPLKVKVKSFDAFRYKGQTTYRREVISELKLIPWKRLSSRPSKFPVRYLPKPGPEYQEMGYIMIRGTAEAGLPDLMDALLVTAKARGIHAVTALKFGVYVVKPDLPHQQGVLSLEATLLQRP